MTTGSSQASRCTPERAGWKRSRGKVWIHRWRWTEIRWYWKESKNEWRIQVKMRSVTFFCCSQISLFCFGVFSRFWWPANQWTAPSSPPENRYIYHNSSISLPSWAGQKDLLCDWAHAKSQQGGVKPAGIFHIHTLREYIISPSVHCVLSRGEDLLCWITLALSWLFFLPHEGKLSVLICVKCGPILLTDYAFSQIRRSGFAGLQDRWWPMAECVVPSGHHPWSRSNPPTRQALGLNSSNEGSSALVVRALLSLPWSNKPRIKMSHG